MSAYGMTATVLATQLAEAVLKDESSEEGGFDLSAGLLGRNVSDWIRETAKELNEQARLLGMSAEREVKLLAEIEQARRTAEYWKAEHIAANAEIERQKARYALLEESYSLLRTEIEAMKRQKPAAWMCPDDPDSATAFRWKSGVCGSAGCIKQRVPLYRAPGAQEK